jgi:ubiquinone/menaquinone biosynthesis C-methylase UbiE
MASYYMIRKILQKLIVNRAKQRFKQDHLLDMFDEMKRELNKCSNLDKQLKIVDKMKLIANKTRVLRGWPQNARVFWDNEADIWRMRVDESVRKKIWKEFKGFSQRQESKILEIGSGNLPYLNNSVCLDVSFSMLSRNKNKNKVQASVLEIPLKDNCFDTVYAVFLFNYIMDIGQVILECKRVLKKNGKLVIVNSVDKIDNYHAIVEKYSGQDLLSNLAKILFEAGFIVNVKNKHIGKKKLFFITAMS